MTPRTQANPFPALRLAVCLSLAAVAIMAVQIGLLPIVLTISDPGVIFKVAFFMGIATWYGFMMGILPMMMLAKNGPQSAVWGYVSGTITHLLVCLLATLLLIMLARMPAQVVAISLMAGYIPLLAVEVVVLRGHLAQEIRRSLPPPDNPEPP